MYLKKFLIYIVLGLMLGITGMKSQTVDYEVPDGAYEGLFEFKYRNWTKYISAFINADTTYLPLIQTFSLLKVYNEYNYSKKVIKGFFIKTDSLYEIDFDSKVARRGEREIPLNKEDFIMTDMEVYVHPRLMKKVFNLDFYSSQSRLSIKLEDYHEMPIYLEQLRKEKYDKLSKYEDGYAPLLFDRRWKFFDGALSRYNLSFSTDDNLDLVVNGNLNLGLEVIGGSLNLLGYATYSRTKTNSSGSGYSNSIMYDWSGSWVYYLGDNPYLTQIVAGDFAPRSYLNSSLPTTTIRGVSISNERPLTGFHYVYNDIEDKTNPDWQVELWLNNVLYDHALADPMGNYKFSVPMQYGANNIELREFGPKGEFNRKNDLIQISPKFLRPWEIKYSLSAGVMPYYLDSTGAQVYDIIYDGRAAIGLTEWITNDFGVVYSDQSDYINYYDNISFRLFKGAVVPTIGFSPDRYINANLYTNFSDWGSYNLDYSRYFSTSEVNSQGARSYASFTGALPYALKLPFQMGFNVYYTEFSNFDQIKFNTRLSFTIDQMMYDIGYKGTIVATDSSTSYGHSLLPAIRYIWRESPKVIWRQLTPTYFALTTGYSINAGAFSFCNLQITQGIKDAGTFVLRCEYAIPTKDFRTELRYDHSLDWFDNKTVLSATSGGVSFTEGITGVLGFDSGTNDFLFNNPTGGSSVGKGAASFRYYIDANGDNEFNDNEELIPGVRSEMVDVASFDKNREGDVRRAYNLDPYGRYNVIVDRKSFRNPLLVPTQTEFSLVSDPNVYKPINIPCYASGVIEGQVSLNNGVSSFSQSRVQIHVVAKDTTVNSYHEVFPVFTDGSFYMMGVPPGDYYAYIDTMQQNILESVQSKPINFTVNKTGEGDFVSDVNIVLVPKQLEKYLTEDGTLNVPQNVLAEIKKNKRVSNIDFSRLDSVAANTGESSIGTNRIDTSALKKPLVDSSATVKPAIDSVVSSSPSVDTTAAAIPDVDATTPIETPTVDSTVAVVPDVVPTTPDTPAVDTTAAVVPDGGTTPPLTIPNVDIPPSGSTDADSTGSNPGESSIGSVNPDDRNSADNNEKIIPNVTRVILYDVKDDNGLTIEMKIYLTSIQQYMLANPKSYVEIISHSDPFDEIDKAYDISKKRAEAAMKFLTSKGVPEDRIFTIYKGSLQPIEETNPQLGSNSKRNRRLEVKIIE